MASLLSVPHVSYIVAIASSPNPSLMRAIGHVESKNDVLVNPNKKGFCCAMQLAGGRYGNPTCEALEADPFLCVQTAWVELEYWKRKCGEAYLDAYNGGWRKCWTRPERKKCEEPYCTSYGKTVRILEKKYRRQK